ncbi:outer membrane protein OmpA-like peptidoglycan-associated protein [Aliiruegeria haliotis]|uniref:Outer membrane protein OmpA-like peptidoglycan-associated protein n=1 Tax=Aliiruegeria haliotis TaxID=1280846 RepID=A0A2T0RSR6_9RHOB|nr:OmpA family protein [Aliiruegeria haliotis]PRY24150.1 outer membrane protein OmpA-like peptidoglycan-associated protein [Aliiruegeria haliotis]
MIIPARTLTLAACLLAQPAVALDPTFPTSARLVAQEETPLGSLALPLSPVRDGTPATEVADGSIRHRAWQLQGANLTTLQLLDPLRSQLVQAGYQPVFECEATECGGFEFRYSLPVLPAPEMHVDLGDYRFLLVHRGDGDQIERAFLLVSRSDNRGFVQLTEVTPSDVPAGTALRESDTTGPRPRPTVSGTAPPTADLDSPLANTLRQQGHVSLDDLSFQTGSSALEATEFASLEALATFLTRAPEARITLVGHTDAEGELASNIALSRKRAAEVRARLISDHAIAGDRISAEGVGYLAPRAPNSTEDGRKRNRRVEVILQGTE